MSARLRQALEESQSARHLFKNQQGEFHPGHLDRAAREIALLFDPGLTMPGEALSLDALIREVGVSWATKRSINELPRRILHKLPFALFHGSDLQNSFGSDPEFTRQYLEWLRNQSSDRALILTLKRFLYEWPESLVTWGVWRTKIAELLLARSGSIAEKWRNQCGEWHLLDDQPIKFVTEVLKRNTESLSSRELIKTAGFSDQLSNARFLKVANEKLLESIRSNLGPRSSPETIKKVLTFFFVDENRLRFDELKPQIASAVLRPFRQAVPEPALQELLRIFLIQQLKDPRIVPGNWLGVDEADRAVIRRWLAKASIDAFFTVVDLTAKEELHWQQRKAFWTGYLSSLEAWVVFGRRAASIARDRLKLEDASHARLEGGADSSQTALLMQITGPNGVVTICEWSHNGACRGWVEGRKGPKLYEPSYAAEHLRSAASFEKRHAGSWQNEIRSWVRRQTGV